MSAFRRGFLILAAGSLVGKVVALGREVVFASAFGTGSIASGFRVAQTATLVPANLVSGDLLSAAFAPSYAREIKRDQQRAKAMLWGYTFWLFIMLLLVAVLVFVSRDYLVRIMIPGASRDVVVQANAMLAVLCWVIPLYGLAAVQAYALGAHGNYVPTSTRQTVQSLGLLLGTVLAVWSGWIPWLAVGLLVAWFVNSLICARLLWAGGYLGRPRLDELLLGWRFVTSGARSIAPLFALPLALQSSIILERVFASYGEPGLIVAVDYARTISDSVLSVVAVPLGILGLTQLSASSRREYRTRVRKMSDFVLVILLPISALLVVCAEPIVVILFRRGEFGDQAQLLTTNVLVGLSVGLVFQVLGYSLSRALTAAGRNKTVLGWSLVAIAGQIVVQGFGIGTFGAVAIGLGPSVYGLLLCIGYASALGLLGRIGLQLLATLPAILVSFGLVLWSVPVAWAVVSLLLVWSVNIMTVRSLRQPLLQNLKPLAERFAALRKRWHKNRKRSD